MINDSCHIPHPLKREGTSQHERMPAALKDEFVQIDEQTVLDHLSQSALFASFIHYYNEQGLKEGNWQTFFDEVIRFTSVGPQLKFSTLQELEEKANLSPHLALLLSFLQLLQISRDNLNSLKAKHLQFFYKTVLGLQPTGAIADKVAVLFEPEKNAGSALVAKGTVLKGGKDKTGKELFYKTTEELIVNDAKVAEVKTVFVRKSSSGHVQGLYAANDAPTENVVAGNTLKSWKTFGSADEKHTATIGFAISSPLLNLKEGRRRISMHLPGVENLNRTSLIAEYTSVKGWETAVIDTRPGLDYTDDKTAKGFLLVKLDTGHPPLTPYNEKVHTANMQTIHPVVRIKITDGSETQFSQAYHLLKNITFSKIKLTVSVTGAKNLVLQNDLGTIDPVKPFQPFGPLPVKHKSTLYIGNPDIFNQYLKSFHVAINWKGVPGNLAKYYEDWKPLPSYLPADFLTQWNQFTQGHPPGKLFLLDFGKWELLTLNEGAHYRNVLKQNKAATTNTFKTISTAIESSYNYNRPAAYTTDARWGFAKIELRYDFGHRYYAKLLTERVLEKVNNAAATLPSQPYTPEFHSLHLDYVAEATIDVTTENEHRFFHLHPFGHAEVKTAFQSLLPLYEEEGTLLIGLSGITEPQVVSILFQLQNDTGNPDSPIGEANKISWYVLVENAWRKLDRLSDMQSDTTQGFTTTGLIKFILPADAFSEHSLLTNGLVWIKASVHVHSDAYPLLLRLETQAIEAEFDDRGNDPYHLQAPLPAGSISKAETKIPGIKSVSQPFASYEGYMAEQNIHFITRVSERLRHKSRAWNIWDYERMLLDEFPQVYKIKCISHASTTAEYSVGQTLIIVLPNPANLNFQDPLKPRVSKSTIEDMKAFIRQYTSPFVHINIANPNYEAIRVECDVKLKKEYNNEAFYRTQLKSEISAFIAPWTANSSLNVSFGSRLFKSAIINFIEERPYIDYVTNFEVFKQGIVESRCDETITASTESSILTSVEASLHIVNTNAVC